MLSGPRRVEFTALDLGEPAAGQVRVAVEGCGVCGSNRPVWDGRPWFEYPLRPGAPGHEAWGEIEEVGDGVDELRVGDRVALLSELAFAEVAVVPAVDAIPLTPGLAGSPFPGEALGCGFNVAARSGFSDGATVCVVGVGFLGAIIAALAVEAGAQVIAVSRRAFALETARTMGAHHTVAFSSDGDDVVGTIRDLTDGRLCDVVVEAVGTQAPLDLAGQLTTEGGRLVIAGFHQDGPRTVDVQLWNWRGIDVVNAHERDPGKARAGVRAAIAAVTEGRLDPTPLYTHRYPLDRLGDAMDAMAERPDGFLKATVHP